MSANRIEPDEWIYVAYEAIVPGTEIPTGTTFGWADEQGAGGQSAIYYVRYNGAIGAHTTPQIIAPVSNGQQFYPDLAVDAGTVHARRSASGPTGATRCAARTPGDRAGRDRRRRAPVPPRARRWVILR